jgi:hypothetical protein
MPWKDTEFHIGTSNSDPPSRPMMAHAQTTHEHHAQGGKGGQATQPLQCVMIYKWKINYVVYK